MEHRDDIRLYNAFSRDADIPASLDRRLADVYETVRQDGRGKEHSMNRHMKKGVRTALLIAAVMAVLTVSAVAAVYHQSAMEDRRLSSESKKQNAAGEEIYLYSAAGAAEPAEEPADDAGGLYPAASTGSPEYLALKEWVEYEYFDEHEEVYVESERLPADDPIKTVYGIGWRGLAERMRAIAEKYGLRLHTSIEWIDSVDALCALAGIEPFMRLDTYYDSGCSGYVYEDGSFQLTAVNTPTSAEGTERVVVGIWRAVKGSFSDFETLGTDPAAYEYETYTTADGTSVDLALGEWYSTLFTELDNCYVTIDFSGGSAPVNDLKLLDMAALEYIADNIDFAALSAGK